MTAFISIGWFLLMLLSVFLVFEFVGLRRVVQMFPEGNRWWLFPVQVASLAFFAAMVHYNPF